MGTHELPSDDALLDRLEAALAATRPVIFILGSALSLPLGGAPGVPGAGGMIGRLRASLTPRLQSKLDAALQGQANAYTAAFRFLIERVGQDAANHVVQAAVLEARTRDPRAADEATEDDLPGWHLTPGLAALGQLVASASSARTLLTTNFDPLIEVALRRAGAACLTTTLSRDGNPGQAFGPGHRNVVHLHGFWRGDTLHTDVQLTTARPVLKQSLIDMLRGSVAVVLGYGGWDDVFMDALADLAHSPTAGTDVLWAFREAGGDAVRKAYPHVFKTLSPAVAGRFMAYTGVDVHRLLPDLAAVIAGSAQASPAPPTQAAPPPPPRAPSRPAPVAAPAGRPLSRDELEEVYQTALVEGLDDPDRRALLLRDVPRRNASSLPRLRRPSDQLRSDLDTLNGWVLPSGGRALGAWLRAAEDMSVELASTALFRRLRGVCGG